MKSILRQHIAVVLIFKLLMLSLLGYLFYGVIGRKKISPDVVASSILSATPKGMN